MLNTLDIELEKHTTIGDWHIGVIVNNDFLFYTTNEYISIPLNSYPALVQLVFTGKKYNNLMHADNYCKINKLYLNQLVFPYLIQHAQFTSDNPDYKVISACDYINLNGVWRIEIEEHTASQQLRKMI